MLVTDELVRAIRAESAAALMHWFGVGKKAVWRWRLALLPGKGKFRSPGSWKAHAKACAAGGAALQEKDWTEEELDRKAAASKGREPPHRWKGRGGWTAKEVALCGTAPDAEVAARLGRTRQAVRAKRGRTARGSLPADV